MTARLASYPAGRTLSAVSPDSPLTASASGSRFPELADRDWWLAHATESDTAISMLLGCHRDTVRAARLRQGVPPISRGRRRGVSITVLPSARQVRNTADVMFLARYARENRPGGPAPTEDLLVARIRAAHEARSEGDEPAYDDALLAIGSAAALIYGHRQRLRHGS